MGATVRVATGAGVQVSAESWMEARKDLTEIEDDVSEDARARLPARECVERVLPPSESAAWRRCWSSAAASSIRRT